VLEKSTKQLNRISISVSLGLGLGLVLNIKVRVSFRVSIRLSAQRFSFVKYRPLVIMCYKSAYKVR